MSVRNKSAHSNLNHRFFLEKLPSIGQIELSRAQLNEFETQIQILFLTRKVLVTLIYLLQNYNHFDKKNMSLFC